MAKNIGIIGSRGRNSIDDFCAIEKALLKIYRLGDTIISGGCPKGADHFAEMFSTKYDIPIRIICADWETYGFAAGFIRNSDIARESDILIACVAKNRKGGTEDTIKKFKIKHPKSKIIIC